MVSVWRRKDAKRKIKKACMWNSVMVNYITSSRSKVIAHTEYARENPDPKVKKLKENET
jgi:hypothetical protein